MGGGVGGRGGSCGRADGLYEGRAKVRGKVCELRGYLSYSEGSKQAEGEAYGEHVSETCIIIVLFRVLNLTCRSMLLLSTICWRGHVLLVLDHTEFLLITVARDGNQENNDGMILNSQGSIAVVKVGC